MHIDKVIETLEKDADFQKLWAMRDSSPMIEDLVRGRDLAHFVDWRLRQEYDRYVGPSWSRLDDYQEDAVVVCALTAHLLLLAFVDALGRKIAGMANAAYVTGSSAIRDDEGMIQRQSDGRGVVAACSYDGVCGGGIDCCIKIGGETKHIRFDVELDDAFYSANGFNGDPVRMLRNTGARLMFADLDAAPIYENDEVSPLWDFMEHPRAVFARLCRPCFGVGDIGK